MQWIWGRNRDQATTSNAARSSSFYRLSYSEVMGNYDQDRSSALEQDKWVRRLDLAMSTSAPATNEDTTTSQSISDNDVMQALEDDSDDDEESSPFENFADDDLRNIKVAAFDADLQAIADGFKIYDETKVRTSLVHPTVNPVGSILLATRVKSAVQKFKNLRKSNVRNSEDLSKAAEECQRMIRGHLSRKFVCNLLKKAKTRKRILQEILTTEATFASSLETVVACALTPLLWNANNAPNKILKVQDVKRIFGNIEDIKNLSVEFLERLKFELGVGGDMDLSKLNANVSIADVFTEFTPKFSIYKEYSENFPFATQTLKQRAKTSPNWKIYTGILQQHPLFQNQCLESFLIMPIQRLPRYVLLLRDLKKNTPQYDENEKIIDAIESVQAMGSIVNNSVKDDAAMEILKTAQLKFGNHVCIYEPHRCLFGSDTISLVQPDRIMQAVLLVFNDMLLIATPMWNWRSGRGASFNQDSRLSYFDHMMLGPQTKIIELPETHLNQTALRVSNGKEKIIAFLANTRFAELILKSVAYVLGRRSTKVQIMRSDVSLQMFIASYSTMEVTPSSFRVFYNLQLVGPKGRIKNIAKRYSELRNFHNSLRRNYASQCTLPPFPAKEAMTAKRPETIIAERILMLGHYLTALHALGNESIEKEMCVFFGNVDVSWMGHQRPDAPKQLEPGPKTHFESDPKTNFESGPKPHFESDTNNVPPIYTGPQPPPRPCLAQPDTATDDKNVKFELES